MPEGVKNLGNYPAPLRITLDYGYTETLTKKVHIPQARALLSRGQLIKHPAVVLHELAHAYHDQILSFRHAKIREAYNSAKKERRSWASRNRSVF